MKGTIKSKNQITELFEQGQKFSSGSMLALYRPTLGETKLKINSSGRVAYIAGKKLGAAPLRNRAKRRLREAAALCGAPWPGYDLVIVARKGAVYSDFDKIKADFARLTNKLLNQAPPAQNSEDSCQPTKTHNIKPRHANKACSATSDLALAQKQDSRVAPGSLWGEKHDGCSLQNDECLPKTYLGTTSSFDLKKRQKRTVVAKFLGFIHDIPKNIALGCINIYRHAISPLFPPSCRYIPTCSEYALEAFKLHGFLRGFGLAVKRIGRCHPWHKGGYDPVPRAKPNWDEF